MNKITVGDVMKTEVDFVDGMATISEALSQMQHVETKCLIVNKRDEHDEYGMLLISDIARKVLAKDKSPQRVNVYEIMTKPVVTVDKFMDIRYCARLFEQFHLSRAPVLKKGEVIGMISYTDMVTKGLCKVSSEPNAKEEKL